MPAAAAVRGVWRGSAEDGLPLELGRGSRRSEYVSKTPLEREPARGSFCGADMLAAAGDVSVACRATGGSAGAGAKRSHYSIGFAQSRQSCGGDQASHSGRCLQDTTLSLLCPLLRFFSLPYLLHVPSPSPSG